MTSSVEWNGEVAKEFRAMIGSETRSAYQELPCDTTGHLNLHQINGTHDKQLHLRDSGRHESLGETLIGLTIEQQQ